MEEKIVAVDETIYKAITSDIARAGQACVLDESILDYMGKTTGTEGGRKLYACLEKMINLSKLHSYHAGVILPNALDILCDSLINADRVAADSIKKTCDTRGGKTLSNGEKYSKYYDYVAKTYGFNLEEMTFLKEHYSGLLLSLYGASMYSSADADKIYREIRNKLRGVVFGNTDTLQLQKETSFNDGRHVQTISSKYDASKWWARENQKSINPTAKKIIGESNEVNRSESGVLTDKDGRYWVAVGPNVMNPEHLGNEKCSAEEMNYGANIDVVLEDENGNEKYLYCTVGECKAHTYPDGIHQTGDKFPNACESYPANADDSVIEFCGAAPQNLAGYKIKEVIVYEN